MTQELLQRTNFKLIIAEETKSPEDADEAIFLLPGTGFNVRLQMDILSQNPSYQEVDLWLKKTKEDIKAFWLEYLARLPILPIKIGIDDKKERLIAPEYADAGLVDVISAKERNGSVKNSVLEIENFLIKAKSNSVAALISPPGWTNLKNEDGISTSYKDTQIYIFYKDEQEKIRAFTLVSNLSLEDNRNLVYNFSGKDIDNNLSTKEKIIAISSSPLLLESCDQYSFDLEGLPRAIHTLYPNSFNLEEAVNLINNLDNLETIVYSQHVDKLIANFENSLIELFDEENPSEFRDKTAKLLGLTVLEISKATRMLEEGKEAQAAYIPIFYNPKNLDSPKINYRAELLYLQSKGGCNGGGRLTQHSKILETVFGQRNISTEEAGPSRFCSTCNQEVKTYVANGVIYCSLCHEALGTAPEEGKD